MTRCRRAWPNLAASALALVGLVGVASAQTPAPAPPPEAPALAPAPDWSLQARQRLAGLPVAHPDQALAERSRLLDEGERQLAAGQPDQAQDVLDRAAMMLHAADTEAALVRAYMQAGQYRRALAFGAHAAGAHRRDWPAGTALYAWLLQVGGQSVVARRVLDEALALAPDDAALRSASHQLNRPWPAPDAVLRQPPLRTAPYAWGAEPPADSEVVGSGVLLDDGVSAAVPTTTLGPAPLAHSPVWLRNGLGQTVSARLQARDEGLGLTTLRLDSPLPRATLAAARREPFAGSPGYMVEYAPTHSPSAAWPLLRQGFFARLTTDAGLRRLGLDAPAGPRGGPVFNARGEFAGVAVPGSDGPDRLVPASMPVLRAALPGAPPAAAGGQGHAPEPAVAHQPGTGDVDAIYEQSLRIALQVIRVTAPTRREAGPAATRPGH